MSYKYNLNIADILVSIASPNTLRVENSCAPFIECNEKQCDIEYVFRIGKPRINGERVRERNPVVYRDPKGFFIERNNLGKCCSCVHLIEPFKSISGWIFPEYENQFMTIMSLLNIAELEIPLASIGVFSLHSSIIKINGRAILFSAPSGTGKSTQANLWEENRFAEITNGDRALIRKKNGSWIAYGSPFAGSSEIYRNEKAPIQAVVVLEQSLHNEINELTPAQAFRHMYTETIIPRWNNDVHLALMNLLTDFVREVKIVKLRCLPDQSAVDLLDNYLNRER